MRLEGFVVGPEMIRGEIFPAKIQAEMPLAAEFVAVQ
jgi:hypothetical protein